MAHAHARLCIARSDLASSCGRTQPVGTPEAVQSGAGPRLERSVEVMSATSTASPTSGSPSSRPSMVSLLTMCTYAASGSMPLHCAASCEGALGEMPCCAWTVLSGAA